MFHIVLVEPEIPQNAGNIARTCAATGCILHLVRPLGFEISDKYLKRAGLDYWHLVDVRVHDSLAEFLAEYPQARMHLFTTKARKTYAQAEYREGDFLVFGKETRGLEEEFLLEHADSCVRIPMRAEARSLNLSNSVAIAVYEGLRQNRWVRRKIIFAAGRTERRRRAMPPPMRRLSVQVSRASCSRETESAAWFLRLRRIASCMPISNRTILPVCLRRTAPL